VIRVCSASLDLKNTAPEFDVSLVLRQAIYDRPFYRLLHAEGDGVPGLVIDRFDDTVTVQIGTAGMERQIEAIAAALERLSFDAPLRDELVRAGRIQAARFDWDTSAAGMWKIVTEAAA